MPNIGSVLKEEIIRLSRKESRSQIEPTKKAAIRQRREVAELKRQVAQLELPRFRGRFSAWFSSEFSGDLQGALGG